MIFIDGWLALATSISPGAVTESIVAGYARQPVSFGVPVNGLSKLAGNYTFGPIATGTLAGRAIFDAPTGGNLLLTMTFATPRNPVQNGPVDAATVGDIEVLFTQLAAFPDANAITMSMAAASVIGSCRDPARDRLGWATAPSGEPVPTYNNGVVTSGVALSILRGTLLAASALHSL